MVKKENEVLIGTVGVDSGQIMCCDPCYIDDEWEQEPFDMKEKAVFPDGHEEEIERCSARWWEVLRDINDEKIKLVPITTEIKSNFSYNAVSHATLGDKGYGQLNYRMGHPGVAVAFRSGIGDGAYPVYAKIEEVEGWGRRITEVRIDLMDHPILTSSKEEIQKGKKDMKKPGKNLKKAFEKKRGRVERNA